MELVMAHAETSRVFAFVRSGDRDGLAAYLTNFVRRLEAAGAEFAVLPAVTPHFCARELAETSPLPLLNIFEPLIAELSVRSIKRVAVFGTRFVMDSDLFGMVSDVEIIHLRSEEADYVHRTYMELVERRKGSEEQHRGLTELAQTLCRRDGAEAILLAGSELALLFHDANTDFPSLDCAALHLRAITNHLFGETR